MKFSTQKYSQDLRRYYQLPAVQSSLTLVLSVFVIAIFVAFALRPTLVSIATLKVTIAESSKTSQILKTKVKNLQVASSQLEAMKAYLPLINAGIPNTGVMYGNFVSTIEQAATSTGVKLDTESLGSSLLFSRLVSPFNPDRDQSVLSLQFTINAVGNYANLSQFLTLIMSMERMIAIDSINISPQAAGKNTAGNSALLKLDIAGNTFYLASEAQITKILSEKKGKK